MAKDIKGGNETRKPSKVSNSPPKHLLKKVAPTQTLQGQGPVRISNRMIRTRNRAFKMN